MKAKISALMDGELQDLEFAELMRALREGGEALETWREYHLISDALRDTQLLSSGFSLRVAARLAEEPTVLAPARFPQRVERRRWVPLSAAASLAGAALVAWVAFAPQPEQMAQTPVPPAPVAAEMPAVPIPRTANDYLLAHPGVAGFVRTVSDTAHPR